MDEILVNPDGVKCFKIPDVFDEMYNYWCVDYSARKDGFCKNKNNIHQFVNGSCDESLCPRLKRGERIEKGK